MKLIIITIMSSIFYYSNFCDKSKNMLGLVSRTDAKQDMHFICIDNRIKENNATYIILDKGEKVLLPPTVNKVPALLLLNKGHHVLFGHEIEKYISPKKTVVQESQSYSDEPSAFSLGDTGYGVASDNFSFLDQDVTDMSAKGEGGIRQMHHYCSAFDDEATIDTPPDNYEANTIKNVSLDKLQEERNMELSH